jgi:hypothetical protein
MAIVTADGWFAAAKQKVLIRKLTSVAAIAATPFSSFDVGGLPGAGTLTIGNVVNGVVPTDAVAGFPTISAFNVAGGTKGYLAAAQYRNSVAGGAILYDRLFHAGSVVLTTLVTTTLAAQPSYTSRLPNGTDYGNLDILLEINAAVSATATTVTVTYTNEAGVAGRSTGASVSLSGFTNKRLLLMPLQAGDKGVQKIESIIVGGTVATTGSVNVVVARRLAEFDIRIANAADLQAWDAIGSPEVFADSALFLAVQPDSTATGVPSLGLDIING